MEISNEYLAGFVDGEGSIYLYRIKNKVYPALQIDNTNNEVLKLIQLKIGGTIKKKPKINGHKQVFRLDIRDFEGIRNALLLIREYLVIRRIQAELLIEFCNSRLSHRLLKYTTKEEQLIKIFSQINKRGEPFV